MYGEPEKERCLGLQQLSSSCQFAANPFFHQSAQGDYMIEFFKPCVLLQKYPQILASFIFLCSLLKYMRKIVVSFIYYGFVKPCWQSLKFQTTLIEVSLHLISGVLVAFIHSQVNWYIWYVDSLITSHLANTPLPVLSISLLQSNMDMSWEISSNGF